MKKKVISYTLKLIIYLLVLLNAGYCIYIFNTKDLSDIYDLLTEVSNNAWLLAILWALNQILNIDDDKFFPLIEFFANKFLAFFFWLNVFVYTPIRFDLFPADNTVAQLRIIYYIFSVIMAIILCIKIDVYNKPPLQWLYLKSKIKAVIKDYFNRLKLLFRFLKVYAIMLLVFTAW